MKCRLLVAAVAALGVLASLSSTPAQAEEVVKQASRIVLLSDHTTPVKTWAPLTVRLRVEGADGTPLAGRSVRIWDDSYERWRCCGPPPWRTTDANGEVSAVLHLDGNSRTPVRVAAYWYGDATYEKAITEWYQPMIGYDTSLTVTHASRRTSGETLPVTLSVERTDQSATNRGCVDGAVVQLQLAGPTTYTTSATVQHNPWTGACSATVEFSLSITPGTYLLTASTGHAGWSREDEPATYRGTVQVDWQHSYSDAAGRGTIRLNLATKEYRVELLDGRDSGVRLAGEGLTRTGVTGSVSLWRMDLSHSDGSDRADGYFLSTGAFAANGLLAGAPWELSR